MIQGEVWCPHCSLLCSLFIYARDHRIAPGEPRRPRCVDVGTRLALRDRDWVTAGNYAALMELAGVIERAPVCVMTWAQFDREPDEETGEVQQGWRLDEMVEFVMVCPRWAKQLAKKLTRDHDLGRRLGYVQTKQLKVRQKGKPQWEACSKAKTLPIEVRARIIRAAAASEMSRTLIEDDPEAAALILRATE